jgi:ABC-type taurine transport system ATPase subunit
VIELAGLCCAFGEFALRDISLRIDKGDYWVILGPSGCGKSVLLQTIAGFFPTSRFAKTSRTVYALARLPARRSTGRWTISSSA